jgi:hypothetical protein
MTEHEFTPDQIEEGIAHAVRDREFTVIPGLVRLLAVQSPERAQRVLDALQGRYTVDLSFWEVSR